MAKTKPRGVAAVVASAGGVETLRPFVHLLPPEVDLGVLVVLHIPPTGPSVLPAILGRAGLLPARHPIDGERLCRGTVLVAPPDRHLVVEGSAVRLDAGARVNGHRPSADVLLHSLAHSWRDRAAGVVLSGTMDDGAAGLRALRSMGGLALVQDPREAAYAGMPEAAIAEADPQVVGSVESLVEHLLAWAEGLPKVDEDEPPTMDAVAPSPPAGDDLATAFTCPDCGGTLFLHEDFGVHRFRCRVGHAFSPDALLAGKQNALEATLWAAVVALRERADLCARMAERFERRGMTPRAERYLVQEADNRQRAELLTEMVPTLVHGAGADSAREGDGGASGGR